MDTYAGLKAIVGELNEFKNTSKIFLNMESLMMSGDVTNLEEFIQKKINSNQ